jgi:hypothetical protein
VTTASALARVPGARVTAPAGGLLWAFHEGFAAYVSRLADGRVDVDGGARLLSDGRAFFPFSADPGWRGSSGQGSSGQGSSGQGSRGYGALHFTGHHGLLAVTLAEPAIITGAGTTVLTITDPFSPGDRLPFAELGEANRGAGHPGVHEPGAGGTGTAPSALRYAAPILTEEGSDLFLGHYREGTPLAPLEVLPALAPADQDARDD